MKRFVTGLLLFGLTATLTAAPTESISRIEIRTCTAESKEIDKLLGQDEFGNILLPFYLNEKQLDGIINRDGASGTAQIPSTVKTIIIPQGHKVVIVEDVTGQEQEIQFEKPTLDTCGKLQPAIDFLIRKLVDKKIITISELREAGLLQ